MTSASNSRANVKAQQASQSMDEDPTAAAAKRQEHEQEVVRSKLADQSFNARRYGDPLAGKAAQGAAVTRISSDLEQKWLRMLREGRPSSDTY